MQNIRIKMRWSLLSAWVWTKACPWRTTVFRNYLRHWFDAAVVRVWRNPVNDRDYERDGSVDQYVGQRLLCLPKRGQACLARNAVAIDFAHKMFRSVRKASYHKHHGVY